MTSDRVAVGVLALLMSVPVAALPTAPAPRPSPRFPVGHALEGLPTSETPGAVYSRDPAHPLNELHTLLFTQDQVPEEIAAVLPAERADRRDVDFFVKGWQFGKRKGTTADRVVFGGDVRVSALTSVGADRRKRLLELLSTVSTAEQVAAMPELKAPVTRILFQWDVVSVWWRLETSRKWGRGDDTELLTALAKTVRALALPRNELTALPAGTAELTKQFAHHNKPKDGATPYLPPLPFDGPPTSAWVEVDRKAGKLFRGDQALRASRIFLNAGDRASSAGLVTTAAQQAGRVEVPDGTEVALVLSLVAFDTDLKPVATPVIDEVRVRRLSGPFKLTADNPTSSKDGMDHWVYFRSRAGSALGGEAFRFVPDTTQGLFLEYGSAKHTTFAAQCALCHRTDTNTPSLPRGVSVLNPINRPRVADAATNRFRVAEDEMRPVADRLRDRLNPKGE
ncbi:hypothetical protein R5W24_003480 [Gemmata sp. JC717]|uniref:hypothetical protein n=1 Tax=Gemmata algarum TaxID=2975278 RepID=UPI0021BB795A|nr:hypothetical protein [Gemmata algarum]MDY3554360.1 hypothetical protein [Gemmata algarum]